MKINGEVINIYKNGRNAACCFINSYCNFVIWQFEFVLLVVVFYGAIFAP